MEVAFKGLAIRLSRWLPPWLPGLAPRRSARHAALIIRHEWIIRLRCLGACIQRPASLLPFKWLDRSSCRVCLPQEKKTPPA